MGETSVKLLENFPNEKCWKITARTLIKLTLLRGGKSVAPLLGVGEGIIAPVMAVEKFREINKKIYSESGRKLYPLAKEMFNLPLDDIIGIFKVHIVAVNLLSGPGYAYEIVEKTPERIIWKVNRCPWWDVYEELKTPPEFRACDLGCPGFHEGGLNEIDAKITFTSTKAMPRGDPYCERIYELKKK